MNLTDLFRINFARHANKIAIRFEDRALTFGELDAQSNRVARAFQRLGLQRGDRVAFYLGNRVELILAHLANLKLGLVLVPMNTQYRDTEISHIIADAEPRALFTDRNQLSIIQALISNLHASRPISILLAEELDALSARESSDVIDARVDGDDLAAIMYTSGTTGRSKGAMLAHDNFIANITGLTHAWAMTADDRLLLALPLFHTHGLGVALHGALTVGATTTLHRAFRADLVFDALARENISLFMGVPTMYVRLLEEIAKRGMTRVELPQMRLFVSGSAPLSIETFEQFEKIFGHKILERYGMTETVMNISNLYAGARIPGTVGVPLPGVSARVADERGNALPDGEVGEILLRGSNVFRGYWRAPEKTVEAFIADADSTRWFRTGDLGKRDPHTGYFSLLSRRSDLIISGGYNIYPREVEELLHTHPAVLEAAVIAKPDAALGEIPVAFVALKHRATTDELIAFCNAHLARYKVPRAILFLDTLPRNAMGKIEKKKLVGQI
ncbi:MAG: AMP-binding protein [Chloroflexi bacterium]|nr:AMP-binding protein [Chloroflexota bacterium]